MRQFSIYAQNRDFGSAVIFRNCVLKVPKKKVPRKGEAHSQRMRLKSYLNYPDPRNEIGLRDKTLLCFMYASGTRAQEVCDLTVGDIQFYPDRAGINIHGKGQKVRRIGIPCDASNMLKKYIVHRRIIITQNGMCSLVRDMKRCPYPVLRKYTPSILTRRKVSILICSDTTTHHIP